LIVILKMCFILIGLSSGLLICDWYIRLKVRIDLSRRYQAKNSTNRRYAESCWYRRESIYHHFSYEV